MTIRATTMPSVLGEAAFSPAHRPVRSVAYYPPGRDGLRLASMSGSDGLPCPGSSIRRGVPTMSLPARALVVPSFVRPRSGLHRRPTKNPATMAMSPGSWTWEGDASNAPRIVRFPTRPQDRAHCSKAKGRPVRTALLPVRMVVLG